MSVKRRGGSVSKSLKDYMVPIIGVLFIGIIVYNIFYTGGSDEIEKSIKYENQIGLEVTFDSNITESYIVYPGENKKQIDGGTALYKGEKILVKEGSVSIGFPSIGDFRLDKNGDLKYSEDGTLMLGSSDLWVNAESDVTINMRYGNVLIREGAHVSLSQNEMQSTVYLLAGSAEITNLAGVTSVLGVGQKITISRLNASNDGIDLSMYKEDIDDFFKASDWFIKNNGAFYLSRNKLEDSFSHSSGSLLGDDFISFNNLVDESYVSSDSIDIIGEYLDENVNRVVLNGVEATFNQNGENTFSFQSIDTSKKENDLVFKVYDENDELLSKIFYVVYYRAGIDETSSGDGGFSVKNYAVDGSKFTFTSPTEKDSFVTFASFVTIKGKVLAEGVKKVSINGYELKSFNGVTWRYHADVRYNNLKTGTNIYEVKYFDAEGKIIYINNFTIIKKPISSSKVSGGGVYSGEAQVN